MRPLPLRAICAAATLLTAACGASSSGGGNRDGGAQDGPPEATAAADAMAPAEASAAADATMSAEAAPSTDAGASDTSAPPEADTGADGAETDATTTGFSDGAAEATAATEASAGASDAGGADAGPPVVPYIVVDQFGYRTNDSKIAVVRSPQVGFDASPFTPGSTYALVDAGSGAMVFQAAPAIWNGGATDSSSGDQAWWFDFSSVTTPGTYYVLDERHSYRSPTFTIADGVYDSVLVQAARALYYQRDGIAKPALYAGQWSDTDEHPQDAECTPFADIDGGEPEAGATKDVHGGWFNAGDENKYAIWASDTALNLLRAYREAPASFAGTAGDSYNIPESGNGVPDILDEASWGLAWLSRMQNADGSELTIVGNWTGTETSNGADPPSLDTYPCVYFPASTSATWSAAAAFAYGALVLQSSNATYASTLESQAIAAWNWASANPDVLYDNPPGVASYDQELTAAGRLDKEVEAAVYLFELTGGSTYKTVVDDNYAALLTSLQQSSFSPSQIEQLDTLLEYAGLPGATVANAAAIQSAFLQGVEGASVAGEVLTDPYRAYIPSYAFTGYLGSHQPKAGQGNMFYDLVPFELATSGTDASAGAQDGSADDAGAATFDPAAYAEGYLHYFHGVNPLGLVYLTNMGGQGATTSLKWLYSLWFTAASGLTPPPGFVVAGPNPGYTWDVCCPSSCGDTANNALCGPSPLSPPYGQPDQKSYLDFNAGWPLDSWQVSESNNAYTSQYIRLVSKFVVL